MDTTEGAQHTWSLPQLSSDLLRSGNPGPLSCPLGRSAIHSLPAAWALLGAGSGVGEGGSGPSPRGLRVGPGSTLVVKVISTVVACDGREVSDFPHWPSTRDPPAPHLVVPSLAPGSSDFPRNPCLPHGGGPGCHLHCPTASAVPAVEASSHMPQWCFLTSEQRLLDRFNPQVASSSQLLSDPHRATSFSTPSHKAAGPCPRTHHEQQPLHTLGHHIVEVAQVEVQGRSAHQLLLA